MTKMMTVTKLVLSNEALALFGKFTKARVSAGDVVGIRPTDRDSAVNLPKNEVLVDLVTENGESYILVPQDKFQNLTVGTMQNMVAGKMGWSTLQAPPAEGEYAAVRVTSMEVVDQAAEKVAAREAEKARKEQEEADAKAAREAKKAEEKAAKEQQKASEKAAAEAKREEAKKAREAKKAQDAEARKQAAEKRDAERAQKRQEREAAAEKAKQEREAKKAADAAAKAAATPAPAPATKEVSVKKDTKATEGAPA